MAALLETLRAPMDEIIGAAAADLEAHHAARTAELDRREAELAREWERLSLDGAVRLAWNEAIHHERRRCQALIAREMLNARPMSPHRNSLLRLSRDVGAA